MIKAPERQIPGLYHRRIGDITITAVSDGFLDGNLDVLRKHRQGRCEANSRGQFPAGPAHRGQLLSHPHSGQACAGGDGMRPLHGQHRWASPVQSAGCRHRSSLDRERAADPYASDHSAGLTDMATGKRNFPNAELVIHENEPKHWFDDSAMARGDDREKKLFFQAGREQTEPYRDRWRLFQKGEVLPGVTAMPLHGHTPGHTGYVVNSGGESLLIWGDIVHVPEVQTARPEVCMAFDTDKEQAEATRRRISRRGVDGQTYGDWNALHLPGFSHVVRDGTGYRLIHNGMGASPLIGPAPESRLIDPRSWSNNVFVIVNRVECIRGAYSVFVPSRGLLP